MSEKRTILIFTDWYLPAFKAGGPVRSIANLVESLKHSLDITIVTSDRDYGDKKGYSNISPNTWVKYDKYRVMYLNPEAQKIKSIKDIISEVNAEIVYLNSMFSFAFTILPLLVVKWRRTNNTILIAPRGMLGKGALSLKPIKKKLFLSTGKIIGLFSNVKWHATGTKERDEIQNVFGKNAMIHIVPNIPDRMNDVVYRIKKKSELDMLFFSRICEKKNLYGALQIIDQFNFDGNLKFFIYGPIEEEQYWQKCEKLIKKLNQKDNIKVEYNGPINPSERTAIFNSAHVLFFPTLHENFGHVIVEALSSAMPVIISTNTPWRNLLKESAGYDIALSDSDKFASAINEFLGMQQNEYDHFSSSSLVYIENELQIEETMLKSKEMFTNLV